MRVLKIKSVLCLVLNVLNWFNYIKLSKLNFDSLIESDLLEWLFRYKKTCQLGKGYLGGNVRNKLLTSFHYLRKFFVQYFLVVHYKNCLWFYPIPPYRMLIVPPCTSQRIRFCTNRKLPHLAQRKTHHIEWPKVWLYNLTWPTSQPP